MRDQSPLFFRNLCQVGECRDLCGGDVCGASGWGLEVAELLLIEDPVGEEKVNEFGLIEMSAVAFEAKEFGLDIEVCGSLDVVGAPDPVGVGAFTGSGTPAFVGVGKLMRHRRRRESEERRRLNRR